jgi:hypothetical protein
MRGFAVFILVLVALSIVARPHMSHFVPLATGPMPAANIP